LVIVYSSHNLHNGISNQQPQLNPRLLQPSSCRRTPSTNRNTHASRYTITPQTTKTYLKSRLRISPTLDSAVMSQQDQIDQG
jgi:hypothetical protein